jgi:hypothetical protein
MKDEYPGFPRIFPVPLRDDVTVRIQGIPPDLTKAEAEKIARVVAALAQPAALSPETDR